VSWHCNTPTTLSVGVLSGTLSGGTAMSGPPVIMYFLASHFSPAVSRASMMMFFLFSASIAMVIGFGTGLYRRDSFALAFAATPMLLLGAALGAYLFQRSKPVAYRRVALLILVAIGVVGLTNAILHYLQ
jgi:uncharacterized membrane protein YfcA